MRSPATSQLLMGVSVSGTMSTHSCCPLSRRRISTIRRFGASRSVMARILSSSNCRPRL